VQNWDVRAELAQGPSLMAEITPAQPGQMGIYWPLVAVTVGLVATVAWSGLLAYWTFRLVSTAFLALPSV
jgi:hypothetical protein